MSQWVSSDVPWTQRHQRGYWNDTLEVARTHKWFFKYSGKNHVFGWIACKPNPGAYEGSEVCSEVIFKTGEGNAQSVAEDAAKMIQGCSHGSDLDVVDGPDLNAVSASLREAEILLSAADRLITARGDFSDAQMLFEQALAAVGSVADGLEEDAVAAEREGGRNEEMAKAELLRVGDKFPLNAEALVDAGDDRVTAAEALDEQSLSVSITRLRAKITRLRTRLQARA